MRHISTYLPYKFFSRLFDQLLKSAPTEQLVSSGPKYTEIEAFDQLNYYFHMDSICIRFISVSVQTLLNNVWTIWKSVSDSTCFSCPHCQHTLCLCSHCLNYLKESNLIHSEMFLSHSVPTIIFFLTLSLPQTASKNGPTENEARRSEDGEDKKLNKSQQLKRVFKEYGAVGVVFHIGISLTSLGIFYLAVSRWVWQKTLIFWKS